MNYTLSTISKNTGNLAFVGSTDYFDILFEVNRYSKTLKYNRLPKLAFGICHNKYFSGHDYYLISHGDTTITRYHNDIVESAAISTTPYNCHEIVSNKDGGFFAIDGVNNFLTKWSSAFSLEWAFDISVLNIGNNKEIFYMSSNKTVVIKDNTSVFVLKDRISSCTFVNSTIVNNEENGKMWACTSGEHGSTLSFVRHRQIIGTELDQSSSSSGSSNSSESSSS